MQEEKCIDHQWEMANVKYGFIITEKCFHCDKIATYFSDKERPRWKSTVKETISGMSWKAPNPYNSISNVPGAAISRNTTTSWA